MGKLVRAECKKIRYLAPCKGGPQMKKKRYTEEQIAFALRQVESGTPVSEIVRKMGEYGSFTVHTLSLLQTVYSHR